MDAFISILGMIFKTTSVYKKQTAHEYIKKNQKIHFKKYK